MWFRRSCIPRCGIVCAANSSHPPHLTGLDIMGNRLETRCLRADGSEFPAEITVTQITLEKQHLLYRICSRHYGPPACRGDGCAPGGDCRILARMQLSARILTCQITSWNKGAERMYGYSVGEVVGQDIAILAPAGRSQ